MRTIGLLFIGLSAGADAQTLNLVCEGSGAATRAEATSAVIAGDGQTAWATGTSTRSVPFDDQVNIELPEGETGKIRMPRAMLPRLRGGTDGWFEVRNIKRTEKEITGTIQVSIINSPKVRIDRMVGHISISGKSGDFSGKCEPYDPTTVDRKF
jgi:hypothetical protein